MKLCSEKTNQAFQHNNFILSVKHGGSSIMMCACFAAFGLGWPAIRDRVVKSELNKLILQENLKASICELMLKKKVAKHRSCSTTG